VKIIGNDEVEMISFLGTGFLVGSKGYALTASHVIDVNLPPNHIVVGMFADKETNKWAIWNAIICDTHPTEDVALLKMAGNHWGETTIRVSFEKQFSSFEYKLFGYPSATLFEDVDVRDSLGRVLGRPDLIFSSGHIRRRASFTIPSIRGKCFYELSQPVGSGCSGSPVFKNSRGIWEVVGIYVADKTESVLFNTYNKELEWVIETIEMPGALAYAVRMDGLAGWRPNGLENTLNNIP
jgi:Trypsin-like peptidase domain